MAYVELRTHRQRVAGLCILVAICAILWPPHRAYADGGVAGQPTGIGYTMSGCPQGSAATNCATSIAFATSGFGTWNTRTVGARTDLYTSKTGGSSGNTGTLCYVRKLKASPFTKSYITISWNAGDSQFSDQTWDDDSSTTIWDHWYRLSTTNNSGTCTSGNDPGVPVADSAVGTPACSRTLTDTAAMTGEFHAAPGTPTNATATGYDWNWGDATTHGTTANANHTYGALSTMPNGGWTAVVTVTYTSTSGHVFAGNASTATATCSLRVDFLHPAQTTPASTGTPESTGDTGLDDCLPSGWNVLNPFAFIGGLGCVFKYLFIPQESSISDLGSLWDEATSKAPFSVVNDLVTYLPETILDFREGVQCSSPTYVQPGHSAVGCGVAPTGEPNVSPICDLPIADPCNGHSYPFAATALDPNDPSYSPALGVARTAFLYVMVAIFIYACWRGAGQVLG